MTYIRDLTVINFIFTNHTYSYHCDYHILFLIHNLSTVKYYTYCHYMKYELLLLIVTIYIKMRPSKPKPQRFSTNFEIKLIFDKKYINQSLEWNHTLIQIHKNTTLSSEKKFLKFGHRCSCAFQFIKSKLNFCWLCRALHPRSWTE